MHNWIIPLAAAAALSACGGSTYPTCEEQRSRASEQLSAGAVVTIHGVGPYVPTGPFPDGTKKIPTPIDPECAGPRGT